MLMACFDFFPPPADITRQSEMSTIVEEPSNTADTSANTTRASRRSERSMGDKSFAPKSPRRSVQPEPMAQLEPEPVPAPQDTFAQIPDGIVDNPADPTTIEPTIDPNLDLDGPPSVAPFSVPPPSNAPPSVAPSMAPVSAALCYCRPSLFFGVALSSQCMNVLMLDVHCNNMNYTGSYSGKSKNSRSLEDYNVPHFLASLTVLLLVYNDGTEQAGVPLLWG